MIALSDKSWLIEQTTLTADPHMETCLTLANGYLGVRGTHEEMLAYEGYGTYVAGIFDQSEAQVTELVNLPYFFGLELYVNGAKLDLERGKVLDCYRALDMKQGVLYKTYRLQDMAGRITKVEGVRFVSQAERARAGIRYIVTAENYSGTLTIDSVTDGTTMNAAYHPQERVKHYTVPCVERLQSQGMYLEAATRDHDRRIGIASTVRVHAEGRNMAHACRRRAFGDQAVESVDVQMTQGQSVTVDKYVIVMDSRSMPNEQLQRQVEQALNHFAAYGLEQELADHIQAYDSLWERMDMEVEGDPDAQLALRFNMFHLMSCANPQDERVSLGAKGLHGEGYKGHVFWDTEIFMLPFFIYTYPEAARAMLMYRYHLLDAARENARIGGYRGARYPWESADSGFEETPRWGFDYKGNRVRIWTGDIEYHITSDIAYAIWQYYRATDDLDFFLRAGAEIFLETARFWSSRCEYNGELDRYEINEVIGPDEFHEHVDNNVFTNYLARWNLYKALDIAAWLRQDHADVYARLAARLGLTEDELVSWREVADKLYVPEAERETNLGEATSEAALELAAESASMKGLLLEQFEGYFELDDRTITEYDENLMPIWPQGVDTTQLGRYTLIKQADVIQLLHMFGENFSPQVKKANFDYYERRTMHKSSLSPSIYCIMGLTVGDHSKAYEYLMRTALVDLANNQGNTDQGLHAASTGGTWQAAVHGFGGMHMTQDGRIGFAPSWIPQHWRSFTYRIQWKGRNLKVRIDQEAVTLQMLEAGEPLEVVVYEQVFTLRHGESLKVAAPWAQEAKRREMA